MMLKNRRREAKRGIADTVGQGRHVNEPEAARLGAPGSGGWRRRAFFSILLLYEQQAGVANLFPGGRTEEGLKLL